MKRSITLIAVFAAALLASCSQTMTTADYRVIPLPQEITAGNGGGFELNRKSVISYPAGDEALGRNTQFLAEYIEDFTGIRLSVVADAPGKAIRLRRELQNDNKDAYRITVTEKEICVDGASDAAVFYGIQTLRKSVVADSVAHPKKIFFPAVQITDYPRFAYRGMHLDVGRHMFPVAFIKKYIDLLALHNVNYFHWHLTDDQGWRVEIKKYPQLTEVGSIRRETLVGHLRSDPHRFDGTPYGGYYTQEEIKEIVRYAGQRYITVIPEIDLPGHMLAALAAYPELGCTGGPYEVATKWGVFEDVLCAGNPKTYEFLDGVFSEIVELFPSKYIHVGGDECPKTRWKSCPKCQAMIRKQGIEAHGGHSAETGLQGYMVSHVEKTLNEKGREIIGWDEILECDQISPRAIIQSWRGIEGGIAAAKSGHQVIMSPHHTLYFDYYQDKDIRKEPLSIGGCTSVEKVYEYDPVPDGLTAEEAKYIIGPQANLWTEYIQTPSQVEYMLLPRLSALSEIQWVLPPNKDYNSFISRMGNMFVIYQKLNCNFARHIYGIPADAIPAENQDGGY